MKIAIISDIHGNISALEAVFKDIIARGIKDIYSTGDLVEYLPFPNEVIDFFRVRKITSIMGNHDLAVLENVLPSETVRMTMTDEEIQSKGSNIYTIEVMTDENKAYIAGLPRTLVINLDGISVRLVHGRPNDINGYIRENCEDFEAIAQEFEEEVLISGHSHVPFHKVEFGKHFVNAGSVGFPKHGSPNATYVVLTNEVDGDFKVDIVEVPYDNKPLIETIRSERRISDNLIERIETGI